MISYNWQIFTAFFQQQQEDRSWQMTERRNRKAPCHRKGAQIPPPALSCQSVCHHVVRLCLAVVEAACRLFQVAVLTAFCKVIFTLPALKTDIA